MQQQGARPMREEAEAMAAVVAASATPAYTTAAQ